MDPSLEHSQDLNGTLLAGLCAYVDDHFGSDTLDTLLQHVQITRETVKNQRWISAVQMETFTAAVRNLLDSDEEFQRAAGYRLKERLGPIRVLVLASTPAAVLTRAAKTTDRVAPAAKSHVLKRSPGRLRVTYETELDESRLMCLVRQSLCMQLPTLWGLPPARVVERSCVAWGDDYCDYEFQFCELCGVRQPIIGAAIGAGLAGALTLIGASLWVWLAVVIGALAGYSISLHRMHTTNMRLLTELAHLEHFSDESRNETIH